MNTIYTFLYGEVAYALGWTVVHSLWQGMLIAFVLGGTLVGLQKRPANLRYLLANLSLLALLLASAATFASYYQPAAAHGSAAGTGSGQAGPAAPMGEEATVLARIGQGFEAYFEEHLPLILCIWLLGVAFFVLRLLGGIAYVQHLKHHRVLPLAPAWQHRLDELASQLRLKRPIRLMESALARAPMVVGYLRPVILLPIGAVNGLSPGQVEAVLAHELAHICRRDYLFNILQSLIEALYYFNPAVWWISANIRMERENCCDDIAVALCGNSLAYAKALVKIEEASRRNPRMAMALARKGKGRLLHRVKRILNQPQHKSNIMEKFTATALLLAAILFLSVSAGRPAEEAPAGGFAAEPAHLLAANPANLAGLVGLDTLPQGKVDIHSHKNGKEVKASIRDGEIVELAVDGKQIPESEFGDYEAMVEELLGSAPAPPAPPAAPAPPAPPAPPAAPYPPAPPAPPRAFLGRTDNIEHITVEKQDGENTTIIIEKLDGEKIELKVASGKDGQAVYLDGKKLEDGEKKVIVEGTAQPGFFQWENFGQDGEIPMIWFDSQDAEGKALRELLDHQRAERGRIQEEMRKVREELRQQHSEAREHQMEALRSQQEEIRRQTEAAMRQYREQLRHNLDETKQLLENQHFNFNFTPDFELDGNYHFSLPGLHGVEGSTQSALEKQLLADGLIETAAAYKFELTGKGLLRVNGKKQPDAVYDKYRKIWEETSGNKLREDTNIRINKRSQAR